MNTCNASPIREGITTSKRGHRSAGGGGGGILSKLRQQCTVEKSISKNARREERSVHVYENRGDNSTPSDRVVLGHQWPTGSSLDHPNLFYRKRPEMWRRSLGGHRYEITSPKLPQGTVVWGIHPPLRYSPAKVHDTKLKCLIYSWWVQRDYC